MKLFFAVLAIFLSATSVAQSGLPLFLQGTWKMEGNENYEHWDSINSSSMKGFSYTYKTGKMVISEYLDITGKDNEILYTATVLNQNQGRGIPFRLTRNDSLFVFENPEHDFPKKIVYQKLTPTEVLVQVNGGQGQGFSYKLLKLPD